MSNFPAHLLDGHRSFLAQRFEVERQRYRMLAERGQTPTTMVIACCDSRAAPETVFGAGPGELFVVRNVANLVPPFDPDGGQHGTSAAIEFAVLSLQVRHVVVMGHGRCGGIQAALDTSGGNAPAGDFIGKWMSLVEPVTRQVLDAPSGPGGVQMALERASIAHSITNLRGFPYVGTRERDAKISIHGAWFDIAEGELWILDPSSGEFAPVS